MLSTSLSTALLPLLVSSGLAASVADAPGTPPASLIDVVPLETTSVWSWRSEPATGPLEQRLERVVDAVLQARFDQFALDVMDVAGAPPDLVEELRSVRNVVASVSGLVRWRALFEQEFVYAETELSRVLPGTDMPGMLLVCRPQAAHEVESSLAGFLGAVAGTVKLLRYDVAAGEGTGTRRYELVLRGGEDDRALVQVAARQGVLLLGMGEEYFEHAVALLEGEELPRLADSERFVRAFEGLPKRSPGRSYVDVAMLVEDLDELRSVLEARAFNGGLWQGVINGALELANTVETVGTTLRCAHGEMITETLTRFDEASPAWMRSGLARSASADLLGFVPGDAQTFDMRGTVDLPGVYTWALERWQADWAPAEDVVWVSDVVQAILGLSIEDDLLPWLGSEHVLIQVPSGASPDGVETVFLSRLADEDGARKCLERAEGVFRAVAPRLLERAQELMLEAQVPFGFDVQLVDGPRDFPTLSSLNVTAFPMFVKQMLFGTLDGYFVFTTSEHALRECLAVSRGEAPGLASREPAGELLGRDDLCSASLAPMGAGIAQVRGMLGMIEGLLAGQAESISPEDHDAQLAVHMALDLVSRVEDVVAELDFLGDAVTSSSAREGGLARYERTRTRLRLPEVPPADEPAVANTTESTPW